MSQNFIVYHLCMSAFQGSLEGPDEAHAVSRDVTAWSAWDRMVRHTPATAWSAWYD